LIKNQVLSLATACEEVHTSIPNKFVADIPLTKNVQAHAFQEGLKLNPADKVLKQGFWDAVSLLSQTRAPLK